MSFLQFMRVLLARRWIFLLALSGAVCTTLAVSFVMPKTYKAETALLIDFKSTDPVSGLTVPAQLIPGYLATQVDIIASHNVALKVVDKLKLADNPVAKEQFNQANEGKGSIRHWLADILLKDIDVKPSRESSVLNITFSNSDPEFAATIANTLAEAYIQTNLELKVEPARQNAAWFDEQLKSLRASLEKAQAKLSEYQQEKGITSIDERLDVENARLSELSTQLVVAQGQTYDSRSRLRQLNNPADESKSESLPEVLSSPIISGMKAELARAEGKFAELSARLDKNHPQYLRAKAEVDALKKKLGDEIKTAGSGIGTMARITQQRESELRKALADQKAKVLELKHQRDEMAILTREVENAQKTYDAAAARNSQTRLESQTSQTNIAVLNPAIPPSDPSRPKILMNVLLSLFLGSLLGVGASLLMEMQDRRIRTEEDITLGLGLPLLGVFTAETDPTRPSRHGWRLFPKRRQAVGQGAST